MFSYRTFFDSKAGLNRSILLLAFLLNCNPIQETEKNVVKEDLTRLLKSADFDCSGDTNREIEKFRFHWKKNPGRYSGLKPKDRWKNVQLTLYVDEALFINESQDSLFIPSGEECSLTNKVFSDSSEPLFQFYATILSKAPGEAGSGQLRITSEENEIYSHDFKNQGEEWKKFSIPLGSKNLNRHSNFRIKWDSKNGSALFLGSPVVLEKKRTEKKNVILIVIDALRQDALSSGGSPFPTTPVLDSLSKDSIVFKNTISNGNWTKPSMLSFFTSEVASNLGLGNAWFYTSSQQRKIFYSKKPITLPNAFREKGYFTESIMNNVFLMDYTSVGVDLGFHKIQQVGKDTLDTEELVSRTETFFRDHKDDLFFLHLNLNTPHWGYRPPARFFQELKDQSDPVLWKGLDEYQQKYLGEVRYTDALLGRIFDELKKQGLFEDSWIVVTSDHGEMLEKSHYYHHHFITETVYAHGETHYEKEIRVPWIIHPPKDFRNQIRKKEFSKQVSLLSLMPTLLGLNGIEYEKERLKGNDYSNSIFGKDGPESEPVIYTEGRYSESIQTPNFKYLRRYPGYDTVRRTREGIPHKMPEELYDINSDPKELSNVAETNLPLLNEARRILMENQLDKNVFSLRLPKCEKDCEREIRFFLKGGIYRFDFTGAFETINEDSKNLNLLLPKESNRFEQTLSIRTVDVSPIFRLQIVKDGKVEQYRVGKWGIRSDVADAILVADPDNVSLGKVPYRYSSSTIPFLYYHTGFSGGRESAEEAAMGQEVRKILESWGYIHQ
ncbi:sulfatase [Leptospira adleri]|uniref:sulfatase n=1 Tax=Leptospira adleri TaxID=2023186 RepID=UPI001082A1FE|nr:sulfatase [Leptospira adleri]TGM53305.1 sulfatase [Leptospira adleri]